MALPALAVAARDRQRARQAAERLVAGRRWEDGTGLIFTTPVGQPPLGPAATGHFRLARQRHGRPAIRFHSLCQGAASYLADAGLPLRAVADALEATLGAPAPPSG